MPKKRTPGVIHFDMIEPGSDYETVVLSFYRDQAARTIQSAYRYAKNPQAPLYHSKKIHENPNLGFNQAIGEHMKTERYDLIDYAHPDFTRHLFAALRARVVSMNQMMTAKLMHDSLLCFHVGQMPAHPQSLFSRYTLIDPKGPYQPTSIHYWGEDDSMELAERLRYSMAQNRYHYYTLNFPPRHLVLFLLYKLKHLQAPMYKRLQPILRDYITSRPCSQKDRQAALNAVRDLKDTPDISAKWLTGFILKQEPDFKRTQYLHRKIQPTTWADMQFLVKIDNVHSQIPGLCRSPQFNSSHPNTPILSIILPTIATFNLLQDIVHGIEATRPMAVTGLVTTRMIRAYDEIPLVQQSQPCVFTATQNQLRELYPAVSRFQFPSRPIELAHPDTERCKKPHDYECSDFLLSWHDLFHTWRNGANFKPLIRKLRTLHDEKAGLEPHPHGMSSTLWPLTDMDFSIGQMMRENPNAPVYTAVAILSILALGGFDYLIPQDDNFLFLYDVCKSPHDWMPLLFGWNPERLHTLSACLHDHPKEQQALDALVAAQQKMQAYLATYPDASVVQIIIIDLLSPLKTGDSELLATLRAHPDNTFFYWSKNTKIQAGLYFKPAVHAQLIHLGIHPQLRKNDAAAIRVALAYITPTIEDARVTTTRIGFFPTAPDSLKFIPNVQIYDSKDIAHP